MTERPFHHGNLRAVLLDEAVAVLRESGVDGLSLRDLARRAGVSHGAPGATSSIGRRSSTPSPNSASTG
ncbi:TetR/AcrR family transcriptional regulator [Curtobacterium sp. 24E2]|nr:helix-turn-helix transcriptional regulator [Curtobacterium sp. 24E2]